MNFEQSIKILMSPMIEGGYANVKRDRGGETKYGISKKRFPNVDIKNLTVPEAEALYRENFWDEMRLDEFPSALRYPMLDTGTLFGPTQAIMWLQGAIGTLVDGRLGPKTMAKLAECDLKETYRIIFVQRARRHAEQDEAQLETFGNGWYARLFDITEIFLKEINKVESCASSESMA